MFSLIAGEREDERIYDAFDIVEFCIGSSNRFSGRFISVDEKGYLHFNDLKSYDMGRYYPVSGYLKIHVSDIRESKVGFKQSNFRLVDSKVVKWSLVAKRAKVTFEVGDELYVEMKTNRGRKILKGILSKFPDSENILLSDVVVKEYLEDLSVFSNGDKVANASVPLDSIVGVWTANNKGSKYKVKVVKKLER